MLWFSVWTVLVLATVAGAFWLGRDLWRKGRALMAELERAGDVVGALADRADALAAAAEADTLTHALLDDPGAHRDHLAALQARRDERRAARAVRHAATFARWRSVTH